MVARVTKARERRIKYEASKRFCREIVNVAITNVPRLLRQNQAVLVIQANWRGHAQRQALQKVRREASEKERDVTAATQIQSTTRVYLARKRSELLEFQRREAASTKISSCVRRRQGIAFASKLREQHLHNIQCSIASILQCFARVKIAKKQVQVAKERRALVESSEAVLCRFLYRVLARLAARRMLQEKYSVVIQRHFLGYISRRDYTRLKYSVVGCQKLIRGHLARVAATRQEVAAEVISMCPELAEGGIKQDSVSVEEEAAESGCSETTNIPVSPTPIVDQIDDDIPTVPLCIDDSATLIQRWFRKLYLYKQHRDKAALVITKAMRTNNELIHERQKAAATRIQAHVRAIQARLMVKSAITERLNAAMQEVERQFNEDWKQSIIMQTLDTNSRLRSYEPKRLPVIRKAWLKIIPKSSHPPYEFLATE